MGTPYLERVARACGFEHMCFGKAMDDGYFGAFGYGNALLSRFPLTAQAHHVMKPHPRHQVRALPVAFAVATFCVLHARCACMHTNCCALVLCPALVLALLHITSQAYLYVGHFVW
jgi:hypothetical protein